MKTRRRDSFRGKMVNYSHMLVAALSVTSLVLLVKYRNLASLLAEEEKEHIQNQKLLLDDLGKEADRIKMLNEELNKRMADIKKVEDRLKGTQDELSNSVKALQASNDQIVELRSEKQSLTDDLANAKDDNSAMQIQLAAVQDELQKTKAMIDDKTLTIKDSQGKQEKLLSENTKLSEALTNVKAENENLRTQVANSLKAAQTSEARMKELEAQLPEKDEAKVAPKETKREEPQTNKPGENKEPNKENPKEKKEPNKENPKEKKELPIETEKQDQRDTSKEAEMAKEESKREANDGIPTGKNPDYKVDEKQLEKDIEVYDMLDDDEKVKLKRELANNEEIAGGGEVVDNPEAPAEPDEYVLADGEGRELENAAAGNDVAAEEFNYKTQAEENAELAKESATENIDENNNEEENGNVLPQPKALEEGQGYGGSFDILKQGAAQSWREESSI